MSPQSPAPRPPALPPFWKWLMRITFAATMALFLVPTVYVVKYYALDRPREEAYARRLTAASLPPPLTADALPYWEGLARGSGTQRRIAAVRSIGKILRQSGVNYKRPLECLAAKAALADMATKDASPAVRAVASEELGKVAQGGAVIRR